MLDAYARLILGWSGPLSPDLSRGRRLTATALHCRYVADELRRGSRGTSS